MVAYESDFVNFGSLFQMTLSARTINLLGAEFNLEK